VYFSFQAIAYRASKVVAERAAWDFIATHNVGYTLVTLCPGMVFGRMIHPIDSLNSLNASNQIVWDVLKANEIPPTKAPGTFHFPLQSFLRSLPRGNQN
jgi:nucleoside-diphosphate-sugar epimerase